MLPSSVVRPPSVMDSLLAAVDDAVVVLDDETRIVALNVAAERLLGLPAGEAVDRPLGELVDLEAIGPGTPVDARAVRAELYERRQWRGRLSVRPLAGSHREHTMVLDASATIVEGPDGHRRAGRRAGHAAVAADGACLRTRNRPGKNAPAARMAEGNRGQRCSGAPRSDYRVGRRWALPRAG